MREKFHSVWRLSGFVLLIAVLLLSGVMVQPVRAFTTLCVAGGFQSPNAWTQGVDFLVDDGTNGDVTAGDGIYSLSYTVATAGDYQFKIVEDCNWGNPEYPNVGGPNAWFTTSTADQVVTFTFDTNTYTDGFLPASNILNVTGDTLPTSFTAVGDWQGFINDNAATAMQNVNAGVYMLETTIPTVGDYLGKVTTTGEWVRQFTAGGRATDNGNVEFSTTGNNETLIVTLNTNTGRIRYAPQGDGETGAAQDNNIWWGDIGHDSRDPQFRSPGGAVPFGTQVTLRLRAAANDLTSAQVRLWNDRTDSQILGNMTRTAVDDTYEYWEYTLNTGSQATVYYYRFIVRDGTATAYYADDDARLGGMGTTTGTVVDNSYQLTVYDPAFQTPDWVQNSVIYQIFVDRFRDGNPANNLPAGEFFYNEAGGTITRSLGTAWNTPICDPRADTNNGCEGSWSRNFYGGDLQGVIDQLDYIQSLGVTTLYLNPIFESPSNHKYDTRDFSQIDDNFGTLATFDTLVAELDARGMYLILDGVFNHTSSDSYYFDRYGLYDDAIYGAGACESVSSPFRSWFNFIMPPTASNPALCDGPAGYPYWFGIFDSLPVLRTQDDPAQNLVWGTGFNHTWSGVTEPIGTYWINRGADGWRLDVAPEVDHGIQHELTDGREQFNPYWENFRRAVHSADPNAYIVGEEWGLSTSWTSGGVSGGVTFPSGNPGEWDATMNYQFSSAILSFWRDTQFVDNDHNGGSSAGILTPIGPSGVNDRLLNLQERYAPEAFAAMMNLFGSHDTSRVLFMLDHGHPTNPTPGTVHPANNSYDWSDAITRLRGAALMQFTLPGAPTIYYGDEVGLVGQQTFAGSWEDDPYNRQPFPWLDQTGTPQFAHLQSGGSRGDLQAYYSLLGVTRNDNPALRVGDFRPLLMQDFAPSVDPLYVYGRRMDDLSNAAVVFVNRSNNTQNITVNVAGYLPIGATFDDALTTTVETYTVSATGDLTASNVPAMNGAILVMTSTSAAPPAAITDLAAVSGTNDVALSWTAVANADSYRIYRSIISGGAYSEIGTSATASYNDTAVVQGTRYYYVVVAVNTTTELESGLSNEVSGFPEWDLAAGGVWYNVQFPLTITHTISTTTRTETVYGQIYIPGGTDSISGQTPGIIAQLGYGPTQVPTDASWRWENMVFNAEVGGGNNDEYMGSLLPDSVGTFYYTTRYSTDGVNWFYADSNGPFDNGEELGVLTVDNSGDLTDPSTPQNLTVVGTTDSSITLSWEESLDTLRGVRVLDSYRIYRSPTTANTFEIVGTAPAGTLTYTDEAVTTNTTYDYYVTALDDSFNESDPSNTVTATAENVEVSVTFRVTVPDDTPAGDTIHITGNQSVWGNFSPGGTTMTNVAPNVWEATLVFLNGTEIEYKFNRVGSWDRVEKAADYSELPNRVLTVSGDTNNEQLVEVSVATWRDPYVIDFSPADGATVTDTSTPVVVTWSRPINAASQFMVTDAGSNAVAGTFAYDDTARTLTFTPDAPYANGVYSVSVTGVQGGDGTQQIPTSFSFTVDAPTGPQSFNLISPENNAFFVDIADINSVSWSATNADSYTFVLLQISENTRLGEVARLENLIPGTAPLACTDTECTLTIDTTVFEALETANGMYSWTVLAANGSGTIEASNAPYFFTVNEGPRQLLDNTGFEVNTDGILGTPDGWTRSNSSRDRVRCDATLANSGNCYYEFRPSATEDSRLVQNADLTGLVAGDILNFSAFVNAPESGAVRIRVIVTYTDLTIPRTRATILIPDGSTPTGVYSEYTEQLTLESTPRRIKVQVQNRSTAGRVYVDDVTLTYVGSASTTLGPVEAIPLPKFEIND